MSRLAILFAVLVIGACAQESHTICYGPPSLGNCKNFRSFEDFEAWEAAEQKKQRRRAAEFPDDFRDIVAVVLKEYLKTNESELKNTRNQYFVSVFGEDIDQATQSKLLAVGVATELGSKYVKSRGEPQSQDTSGTHVQNLEVYVSSLKRLRDGSYDIEFGYSCGELCAGHFRYRVKQGSGGWVFISKKPLWYS